MMIWRRPEGRILQNCIVRLDPVTQSLHIGEHGCELARHPECPHPRRETCLAEKSRLNAWHAISEGDCRPISKFIRARMTRPRSLYSHRLGGPDQPKHDTLLNKCL